MGTEYYGTPANRIIRLKKWGYHVEYGLTSLEPLQDHLVQGLIPIAFVYAEFLPWSDFEGPHAVVVTEITGIEMAVLDPALNEGLYFGGWPFRAIYFLAPLATMLCVVAKYGR